MAKKGENVKVVLKRVRFRYGHLDSPQKFKPQEDGTIPSPKFNLNALLSKKTKDGKENISTMSEAIEQVLENFYGDEVPKIKADKLCMRDGDQEDWDGFAGNMYVACSNKKRPVCMGLKKSDGRLEVEDIPDYLYDGCYADVHLSLWVDTERKRVNAQLDGLQFRGHGERFSGGREMSEDDFEDYEEEDGDEDAAPRSKPKKRVVDEDDDEDRPVKKKKRVVEDDDDDDEDTPRKAKKKKVVDEDDVDEDDLMGAKKKKKRAIDDDDDDVAF